MSHKASHWLAALPPDSLNAGAFRVLFHLCDAHNDTQPPGRACYPSQALLREKTGLSNGGLNNAINKLEEIGLLARRRSRSKDGKKKRTYYILGCDTVNTHKGDDEKGDKNEQNDATLTPENGVRSNSTFEGGLTPLSGRSLLHSTGDKPVKEPKREPKACAQAQAVGSETTVPEPIPDARDQFEQSIWPFHWRSGDNSAKAFIEFEKLSVEERAECVRVMEVAKASICKDQPNPEYRVGLAKWIEQKRFKSLVDAAIAFEKNKAKIDGAMTLDRFADAELFAACEMARGKSVPDAMSRYMFPKSVIEKARATL